MIFSSWWFWVILISIIGLVVAIILFFATDVNRTTVYILLGVFILLLVLGIIFAIRSSRQPKPKQNFGDRFIPGFSEGRTIAERTGLADTERRLRGSTVGAVSSAGRGVGRTAKGIYGNKRLREIAKGQALGLGLGVVNPFMAPAFMASAPVIANKTFRSKQIVEGNRRKELQRQQTKFQLQQAEQQMALQQQQQIGGMPQQQQMGGMPQQQMGGMPQY